MSADPNKKSARTFQCRDVLWDTFEQMARDLECSVDYLINDAMKQYARQRSYGSTRTPYPSQGRTSEGPSERSSSVTSPPGPPAGIPTTRAPAPAALPPPPPGRLPPPPNRSPAMSVPPPRGAASLPPLPAHAAHAASPAHSASHRATVPPGARHVPPPLPKVPGSIPPPPAAGANGFPPPAAQGATLTVVYQGERHSVTKDRFVIGRGKQSSDLTLKDPNVSRQHAMIEFQNGVYFLVDMGSTNGIEFNGQRIARKQIAEGDVYRICDHDITFTYR